jgi:hypothetical protein
MSNFKILVDGMSICIDSKTNEIKVEKQQTMENEKLTSQDTSEPSKKETDIEQTADSDKTKKVIDNNGDQPPVFESFSPYPDYNKFLKDRFEKEKSLTTEYAFKPSVKTNIDILNELNCNTDDLLDKKFPRELLDRKNVSKLQMLLNELFDKPVSESNVLKQIKKLKVLMRDEINELNTQNRQEILDFIKFANAEVIQHFIGVENSIRKYKPRKLMNVGGKEFIITSNDTTINSTYPVYWGSDEVDSD